MIISEDTKKVIVKEIEIDYSTAIEERAAKFNYFDAILFEENFVQSSGIGIEMREVYLVGFNKSITIDQVKEELDDLDLRCGTSKELADCAIFHKEKPSDENLPLIVALGDKWAKEKYIKKIAHYIKSSNSMVTTDVRYVDNKVTWFLGFKK